MKRITPQVKAIADAHIQARLNSSFDDPKVTSKEELKEKLLEGKTFSGLMDEIEIRFTSITAIILSRSLFHKSHSYRKGVYHGFKVLLQG